MQKRNIFKNAAIATLSALILCGAALPQLSAAMANGQTLNVGIINFKRCVEKSQLGQQEQSSFEALKKQAEKVLQDREKEMQNIASKLDDPDYLDSLSKDAEAELKHRFRSLNQQLSQQQQQLYQTLSQANFKIVQKLTDEVNTAAQEVAKKMDLDLILNEEASFFYKEALDITEEAVKVMDEKTDS